MPQDDLSSHFDQPETGPTIPPEWLDRLANLISQAFHAADLLAPVGCHFRRPNESKRPQWEVTLFVSSTEYFGGPQDGQLTVSRFMLDLRAVVTTFDAVESFYWQAHSMADDDQLGMHIGVKGAFEGHAVWLRITAEPPSQFQPGRVMDLCANVLKDRW